ncbi:PREDICTED: glutathione S-transferase T3-like [Brassica oleracea var. oleracea]|uniref:glutathione S-transferase T3-like n=1 Tax=Brassica oleracea var. oleracea TaxID=109376 RepID=UPI0006A6C982|nr:PREDICTED: glutathione S-transferase T3-like [Brassica oleracea var. oleracea]
MDSYNPYSQAPNFVDLLNSQQDSLLPELGSSQLPVFSTQSYYAASPKVERGDKREPLQCKQRWQKLNNPVCNFCGSYAAATRQKTSGQSESDVVKLAHKIFFNDHKLKFNLHHAWEELRYDQKWCEHASSKLGGSTKKRKCEDGAETTSSQTTINLDEQPTKRPAGVKTAKAASANKPIVDKEAALKFQTTCSIKEKDLGLKERLSKMDLLNNLISKNEPLSEKEKALKTKLLTEMLDN